MRTVGIIAEYNPFHTGHEYHIQKAKECAGADFAVVVMSPDYVQRGSPAVFDKYTRAQMALQCGADLVLALPVCYATGSAEYFAEGAVQLLDGLGVIDTLCFGTEAGGDAAPSETGTADEAPARLETAEAELFQMIAGILLEEPEPYRHVLQEGMRKGLTFPRAREEAVIRYLQEAVKEDCRWQPQLTNQDTTCGMAASRLLSSPNNILGVEYCKALMKIHSRIVPLPFPRRGNSYSDLTLDGEFCSASAIRKYLEAGMAVSCFDQISVYLPDAIRSLFADACAVPVFLDDFLPILSQKLIYCEQLEKIFDLSPEMADRLDRLRFQCMGKSIQEISALLKTKQITEARIRRALLHLILDIRKDTVETFRGDRGVYYAHILGFRRNTEPLLHEIKQKGILPLISKASNASKVLTDVGMQMWSQDMAASHLYRAIRANRYGVPFKAEQEISPIRV